MGYGNKPALIAAFRACVSEMQESTRMFAYHAIAHLLEWSDRHPIWTAAGLPLPENLGTCRYEPGQR